MNFMGCLSGADADVLDAHEEGLMKMFCDEYMRYLGPSLIWLFSMKLSKLRLEDMVAS